MSDAPPTEKKAIIGVCEEISEKNGWTTFAINVGREYPVKLQTKLPALIEQGRAAGQQPSTWHYKETQGNPNPNKPGSFYMNRYFESVEAGVQNADAVAASATAPSGGGSSAPKAEAHHTPLAEPDKQRVISRLSCLSSAASLFDAVVGGADVPLEVMNAAQRFETWVYRDIDPVPSSSGAETPPSSAGLPDDDPPFGAPDDGIPY